MSKVDGPAAIAACANLRSRNARSLFISGPTAAAREAGDISSYQPQKSFRTWSRTPAVRRLRVASSPSSGGMSARVTSPDPGGTEPSRVRHAARKMSSVLRSPEPGEDPPEDPGDVVHDHVGVGAADPSPCSTFRHGGACLVSPGSNSTTLPADCFGEAGDDVEHGVALGVDEDDPAPGVGVGEDLPGDQRGLAGAGRPADPQVVAGVGDRQADRARLRRRRRRPAGGRRGRGAGWRAAAGRRVPRRGPGRAAPGRRAAGRSPPVPAPTAGRPWPASGSRSRRRGGAAGGGRASSAR